jgi:branched-chain amino acid transport system substrate-binding protein
MELLIALANKGKMMNILQFHKLNKRVLQLVTPVLLAAMLMAGLLLAIGGGAPAHARPISQPASSTLTNSDVITIGLATDLSVIEEISWRQANAVQLAVDQINAGGGLDIGGTDYTVVLVSADSACNDGQAVIAANDLLDAGAVAVVGHSCSGASLAAQPIYAAAGVPMISSSSTAPQLTDQGYTTTFRVIARDGSSSTILATHLRNRLDFETVAIVEMEGYFGNGANDVFSDTFTSLGGTITSRHTVTSTGDFTGTLTTVMAENPHAIHFVNHDGGTAGLLSKVAHDLGMADVIIAWTTFSTDRALLDDYTSIAGNAAEGDIAAMSNRDSAAMPGYPTFNAEYVAAGFTNYGDEAQEMGAFAYDAAQIIIAAIGRAGSTNPDDIRDEIAATTNYQGVVGTYQGFDAKGDVIPQWAWLEQYQNGKWVIIVTYKVFLPITLKN